MSQKAYLSEAAQMSPGKEFPTQLSQQMTKFSNYVLKVKPTACCAAKIYPTLITDH